ncbi:unnamed protein product, partial [Pylaiella littoralis]
PLRRRVLRSGGTGGAHASAGVSKAHVTDAGRRNGSAVVERALEQPPAGAGRGRGRAGGLRVAVGGDGDGSKAVSSAPGGREEGAPVPGPSSKDISAAPAVVARARTAVPGRDGEGGTSNTAVVQSHGRHEEKAAAMEEEAGAQEQQRRRERGGKDAYAGGRHRETLAFMARQRKQAAKEKRRAEQEKLETAENLRRALEKLEHTRRRNLAQQRPLRSRSRENMHAPRQPRSAPVAAGRARRRPHSSAAVTREAPPPPEPRPAWVGAGERK